MGSRKGHNTLIKDMGYQRENLTWPQDPFVFWNEMNINGLEREVLFSTKGIRKHNLNK